ncbi:hypothetical protein MCETHM1_02340 [Flavobacteriaceae bacterium]
MKKVLILVLLTIGLQANAAQIVTTNVDFLTQVENRLLPKTVLLKKQMAKLSLQRKPCLWK